jgi:hypothetical protein
MAKAKTLSILQMTDPAFEPKPRWPGGPHQCIYENLPAFATEAALAAFAETCCSTIVEKWLCDVCGHWHYIGGAKAPSGASSGTGRAYRPPMPRYRRERGRVQAVDENACE